MGWNVRTEKDTYGVFKAMAEEEDSTENHAIQIFMKGVVEFFYQPVDMKPFELFKDLKKYTTAGFH